MPDVWMSHLIQPTKTPLDSSLIDIIGDGLLDGLRVTLAAMRDDKVQDCFCYDWREQQQLVERWLTGLLAGHQLVEPTWRAAWQAAGKHEQHSDNDTDCASDTPHDPAKTLTRCLKYFSTFANFELALKSRDAQQRMALQQNIDGMLSLMPAMLREYVNLANDLANYLPNQFETYQALSTEPGAKH